MSIPANTVDAHLGMAWWNGMTERERAEALRCANTAIPAEAWRHWKERRTNSVSGPVELRQHAARDRSR